MNPWKLTAIGMAGVVVTALVTGLVVANWTGTERDRAAVEKPATKVAEPVAPAAPRPARVANAVPATPSKSTVEGVKDGAIGAARGAAVGAAGGAFAAGGKGAGKGAAIGGLVGAGAGTLYGLNENKKSDERYRAAYSSCMRSRGYSS